MGEPIDENLADYVESKKREKTKSLAVTAFRHFRSYLAEKHRGKASVEAFLGRVYDDLDQPTRRRAHVAEGELNGFARWLTGKGLAPVTVNSYAGAVKDYLVYRDVEVNVKRLRFPAAEPLDTNKKHEWLLSEIREFVERAWTPRDKAVAACIFQCGLAIDDVCAIDYGDIRDEYEKGVVPLCLDFAREGRGKTAVKFRTFLGGSAVRFLRSYLETRPGLVLTSPLFTLIGSEERATPGAVEQRFSEIAGKVTFLTAEERTNWEKGGWNPCRPHSLRAAFESMLTGYTSDRLIDFWMGHSVGTVQKAYLNMPVDEMRKLYAAVEYRLDFGSAGTSKNLPGEISFRGI